MDSVTDLVPLGGMVPVHPSLAAPLMAAAPPFAVQDDPGDAVQESVIGVPVITVEALDVIEALTAEFPERAIMKGAPSETTVKSPVRVPDVTGIKMTITAHPPPGAT